MLIDDLKWLDLIEVDDDYLPFADEEFLIEEDPICKQEGHDWETYTVSTGYWSYDIEQAGYCKRCGYDTHGKYK